MFRPHLRIRMGTAGVKEANCFITYGRFAMLKLPFVAPKLRLRRVQKKWKKRAKNEKLRFAKKKFYFCMFTSWTFFWGSVRIEKVAWGRCARQNFFLTFRHQLRCAISEISSYNGLIFSESYFGAHHRYNRSCYLVTYNTQWHITIICSLHIAHIAHG